MSSARTVYEVPGAPLGDLPAIPREPGVATTSTAAGPPPPPATIEGSTLPVTGLDLLLVTGAVAVAGGLGAALRRASKGVRSKGTD